jgi:hypothetical protein
MKSIFLLLVFIFTSLNGEYYSYRHTMLRNMGLRILIACNYKKHKYVMERLRNEYQKNQLVLQQHAKAKYMEYSNSYYSLSEEDRMILETIVEMIL